jgi:UDP-3-O-[3-hydroxymyristoyl] glucosamine N-acyltransferase
MINVDKAALPLSLGEICQRYGCVLSPAPEVEPGSNPAEESISALAPLSFAEKGTLSFLANAKYLEQVRSCGATAVFCTDEDAQRIGSDRRSHLLICSNPYAQFARISQYFFRPAHDQDGVSSLAHVDQSAQLGSGVAVFPFAYVGPGARVGANSVLYPGAFVGAGSELGAGTVLYPNAVVREGCVLGEGCILNPGAVVGGDGFGFAPDGEENVKIPQVGGVRLGDHVELGSNATVDRGTIEDTAIGTQSKIDSLVMVGHNVRIGRSCFLAGQSGVAGSSTLGNRVTLAGQVGISGHVKLADHVVVLAKSGVSKNLDQPGAYNGIPAAPNRDYLKREATLRRLLKREARKGAEE